MIRICTTLLLTLWVFAALASEKSTTVVYINGSKYYIHTVQPSETLYALSKLYQVGEKTILEHNPELAAGLKAQRKIKIPFAAAVSEQIPARKLRKQFDSHIVEKGETLYAISRRYAIPIQTIIEDNPNLDPIHLRLGERILIRKQGKWTASEDNTKAQWEEYRNTLNSVSEEGFSYHIVRPGETLYSLARRFGVSEEQLSALNNGLKAPDLKAGAMLKVPGNPDVVTAQRLSGVNSTGREEIPASGQEFFEPIRPRVEFRTVEPGRPLNVALLLPMTIDGQNNANFLEFYQGFLLGLDSVRINHGRSVNLTLYNTGRDTGRIAQIIAGREFEGTDMIVGPVYEEGLAPVLRYAEQHGVPVVSPLANLTKVQSDALFQLSPDPAYKYAKIAGLPDGKRITLIYSGSTDKEFEQEVQTLLGSRDYDTYDYKFVHPSQSRTAGDLSPLLDNGEDNLFVVMANNEVDVDRILAAIASANTNLTARGRTAPRFTVLGNARWNRHNNLDRTMFFKDRVVFTSTYHAKRDSQAVLNFDNAYIRAFGSLPTLYSYRGYDAAVIFCEGMYGAIAHNMEGERYIPLQTGYLFGQDAPGYNRVNRDWTRVNYNTDFTITIE